jgi:hypothetical protein
MTSAEITNLLIVVLISLIGYIANMFIKKMERFEKRMEDILLSDMSHTKDIASMKVNLDNHENRIVKLENNY